MHPKFNFL